ncbi:hypothetical protein Leryth_024538 [Lithospermum erythrorhizon]|nr:hypothetical protein Leryth_024538 [Lithospermum erythrorhizon]
MEVPSSTKQPQISEMFQKFALAFKTKTYELLTGEEEEENKDVFTLLDSAEEFIPHQKVVVIKPDSARVQETNPNIDTHLDKKGVVINPDSARIKEPGPNIDTHLSRINETSPNIDTQLARIKEPSPFTDAHLSQIEETSRNIDTHLARIKEPTKNIDTHSARIKAPSPILDTHMAQSLIGFLFSLVSSFGATYLQLQAAHVPFNEGGIEAADKGLVAIMQKLGEMKRNFRDLQNNNSLDVDFAFGSSFVEFQVQENQSKLRALETMVNQLQSDIECKDDQVLSLRNKLDKIEIFNKGLLKRLGFDYDKLDGIGIKLTFRVFDCMLSDCVKALRCFTKLLIDFMRKAGWDLDKAANSVCSDVNYAKEEHHKYVFLSYVSLAMFRGFNLDDYGLDEDEVDCNGNDSLWSKEVYQKLLIEHAVCNPMEVLGKNPKCDFARFCEKKYEQLIHPSMESSIFSNVDRKEAVLSSWKSLRVFYESFVRMSSSIWLLHKLGYCFDPIVEVFQVERGADFSMVYMEDVTRKRRLATMSRPKVAFTVVPGFKVGRTVIQSQVYFTGSKCTE